MTNLFPTLNTAKIFNEYELQLIINESQSRGEKIIMTNGCFDLLHVGHVTLLNEARKLGNHLIVAVNSDESVRQLKGDSRPINSLEHRLFILASLKSVDGVIAFSDKTPERLYCNLLPDVIVKGGDYAPDEVAGSDCVIKNGGTVEILSFVEGLSTTLTIDKMKGS